MMVVRGNLAFGAGTAVTLPKLSIAAKLYAIFALMATATLALAGVAVEAARTHAALTQQFESANHGSWNVERVNGLLYGVIMETRGIYLSLDREEAAKHAEALTALNDRLGAVMADWQSGVSKSDGSAIAKFTDRIADFQIFIPELERIARQQGPEAARDWALKNHPNQMRAALNRDLDVLSGRYSDRARQLYDVLDDSISSTMALLSALAAFAVILAIAGVTIIWRSVTKPIAKITRVTEAVAAGDLAMRVPFIKRNDEIGALARSIEVFQQAMRHVKELSQKIVEDAEAEKLGQTRTSEHIAHFSAEVEATLAELGRISEQMLDASGQLAALADEASAKTARATQASTEASGNVRDIASAADELSASVGEIDRQVAQSNAIASKAVSEAGRTNLAVKELDEAAARIGDVVKLITDIAEQTNLLALNASIEAARAGEAGRGFAVVAGEVKALAGQTSRATEEIASQIAGMQRATVRSIDAITAIEGIIREIGEISGAIAAAVTEQGAATSEIARSVETAARRTADTASEVRHVGDATEDTRTSASTVKAVADDLGHVASRIRAQVDQFFDRLSA
jgi:methyl-accepting chemotaxis protein